MKETKKKILWSVVLLALIGITLYVIVKSNDSLTLEGFIQYVSKAKKQWIVAAFGCMLGFIVFEALAVRE